MPALNNPTQLHRKLTLNTRDMINAPIIVNITSAIATSNMRYECTPSPGTPNEFLYLHRLIIYSVNIKSMTARPHQPDSKMNNCNIAKGEVRRTYGSLIWDSRKFFESWTFIKCPILIW